MQCCEAPVSVRAYHLTSGAPIHLSGLVIIFHNPYKTKSKY